MNAFPQLPEYMLTTTQPAGPRPSPFADIHEQEIPAGKMADLLHRIALLTLDLGTVERRTFHPGPDLQTHETDTTHTVMVTSLSLSLADALNNNPVAGRRRLDCGQVALEAHGHDYPEAIAGDVDTLTRLDADRKAAKQRAERHAAGTIVRMFGRYFPWFKILLEPVGERTMERRLVDFADKLAPKFCHLAVGCRDITMPAAELTRIFMIQRQHLLDNVIYDMRELIALYDVVVARVIKQVRRG